ncbi:MAG: lipopolysaccharide biosynthesis protein [bacterium]
MSVRKTDSSRKVLGQGVSHESLTIKATLNAFAAALDYGARLAVGFLINPLLVSGLGNYGFGAWQVLSRLMSYLAPASGRPTQALKWTIANQQASVDHEEKRRSVGSAVAVWLLFLPVLLLFGGSLGWFAPAWLKAPVESSWSIRWAAVLLAADLILTSLVELPRSVLEGENLGYKRMGMSTMLVFFGGGLTALALFLNAGLTGVAAATLAATLLTGVLYLVVTRTYVPWFGIARPSFESVRRFLGLSSWFLVWNLVMKLMRASDVVVLGTLGSVESVTTYSLTKYVPESIISFVAIVVFGITPGLGKLVGAGNLKKVAQVRNEIMSLTWLIMTVVGSTILLWNPSFLRLWVTADYDAGSISTLLIVLMVAQFVLIRNDANLIDLTLNLRSKVLLGLFSTTLALAIAGVLVSVFKMGIVGLCCGFIAGRSILSLGYPWLIGRFLGIPLAAQLKAVVRPALVTVLLWVPLSRLGYVGTESSWLGLVFSVGATLAVLFLVAFYTGLASDQRDQILLRVRMLAQRVNADGGVV